jgi:myosin heavy subunit
VPTINDATWLQEVVDAFNVTNIGAEEQLAVWKVLAVVLNLGNVEFDDTAFLEDSSFPCTVTAETAGHLVTVASLLGVPETQLLRALTFFIRKIGATEIPSPITKQLCVAYRDSLAKELYHRLFGWIVGRLNTTIVPPGDAAGAPSIGLLDIFGFELFDSNSFE